MNLSSLNRPLFLTATYPPHKAWKFWLLWVGFTILGCGLGMLIVASTAKPIAPYFLGLTVGALQGLLLRLGASGTVRWTLATTLGLVVSSMIRPYIAFHSSLIASGAFGGLIIGGIQGVVFYTQIPGMGWWVVMKVLSGAISWGVGWSILKGIHESIGATTTGAILSGPLAISLMWGISAAMTGVVMYHLLALRHGPRPPWLPPAA
jgi:hypothetical protein